MKENDTSFEKMNETYVDSIIQLYNRETLRKNYDDFLSKMEKQSSVSNIKTRTEQIEFRKNQKI